MPDLLTAGIAFLGAVAGSYLSGFLGEDYRRHRDGQALAGALAGELAAYQLALPLVRARFIEMIEMVRAGERPVLREIELPNDPIFDSNTGKIGLLGHRLAGDVAFTYQQVKAFRLTFVALSKQHGDMTAIELEARLDGCLFLVEQAQSRGAKLVIDLRSFAVRAWNTWET